MSDHYRLFERFGIELEYMIVGRETFAVKPVADRLLQGDDGKVENSRRLGPCVISNELAAHVIELKAVSPFTDFEAQHLLFTQTLAEIDKRLSRCDSMLVPSGMHPTMDPRKDGELWRHEDHEIYETYNRIFDCNRHGWLNLQSCHLNISFGDEAEFLQLHNAIILLLPVLPAICASTPFQEGRISGLIDTRLEHYQYNQKRFPAIAGSIIPEVVGSIAEYRERIHQPAFAQIAPFDVDGTLQDEWLNSRGAIARFQRSAIEIRLMDVQECAAADFAISALVVRLLRKLAKLSPERLRELALVRTEKVRFEQLRAVVKLGREAPFMLSELAEGLGLQPSGGSVGDFWESVWAEASFRPSGAQHEKMLRTIFEKGNLSERLLRLVKQDGDAIDFERVLSLLHRSLVQGTQLEG